MKKGKRNKHNPSASPLMRASWDVSEEDFKEAIARESKIDRTDQNGDTALHHAGRNMHWLKFRLLLEAGAELTRENLEGRTPLDYYLDKLAIRDRAYIIRTHFQFTAEQAREAIHDQGIFLSLLMSGLWYSREQIRQGKRLNAAIKSSDVAAVRKVLAEGDLVEYLENRSRSPAYLAACLPDEKNAAEILGVLKRAGAHILYPGSGNFSVLDCVRRAGQPRLVDAIDPSFPIDEPLARRIVSITLADSASYRITFEPTHEALKTIVVQFAPRGQEGVGSFGVRNFNDSWHKDLENAGAKWFIPYIKSYAAGAPVVVADLENDYRERFGKALPLQFSTRKR